MSRDDEWNDDAADPHDPWRDDERDSRSDAEFDNDRDSWFEQEDRQADGRDGARPEKRGMSTTTKVLIILACVGGFMCLLCCGGVFFWVQNVKQGTTYDAQEIAQRANDIAQMEIPANFHPKAAMNINMFVMEMKIVVYQAGKSDGVLILAQMDLPVGAQGNQEAQFQQALKQQHGGRNLNLKRAETREFEIRGKKVPFLFAEAQDEHGKAFRQVTGIFPGDDGFTYLMLQIAEKEYDEDAVVRMIKSIK